MRAQLAFAALLAAATAASWAWIVPMARDMYGPMTGPSAWMMAATWDLRYVLLLWAMWGVMMAAMMLPSAAPLLLLYAGMGRHAAATTGPARLGAYGMTAGYLLIWLLFSAAATALQRALSALLVLTPMMEAATATASGVLLLLAGVYQLTPLKARCLSTCRSPLSFIMQRWRPGLRGAFRMGAEHGLYCLGCCWALMLLLFAGGVMNLGVIAALTIFVLVEKIAPFGARSAPVSGVALAALGLWMIVS